jgi:hypothetical protein
MNHQIFYQYKHNDKDLNVSKFLNMKLSLLAIFLSSPHISHCLLGKLSYTIFSNLTVEIGLRVGYCVSIKLHN